MLKISIIALALINCSCSSLLLPLFDISVSTDQPQWAHTATELATEFWTDHGAQFILTNESDLNVIVQELPPDRLGECECSSDTVSGIIRLIPQLGTSSVHTDKTRSCIVAHEMGHALGMKHVKVSDSLMAPFVVTNKDGECYWSDLDQKEFCKARPDICAKLGEQDD